MYYEFIWRIIGGDRYTCHYVQYDDLCSAIAAWRNHYSNPTDERLEFLNIEIVRGE